MEVVVRVDAPGYLAELLKESIGMAAELYGDTRVVSVRDIPSAPRRESVTRLPSESAPQTKKGVA